MHSSLVLLLIALCLTTLTFAKFSCGNDKLQSGFAEILVKNDCKGRLQKIDNCCRNHTQCYEKKIGRDTCDKNFCTCAKNAAKKMPLCAIQMDNFCNTAKSFGGLNYKGK